jgi:hypothetical protein
MQFDLRHRSFFTKVLLTVIAILAPLQAGYAQRQGEYWGPPIDIVGECAITVCKMRWELAVVT